MFLHLVAVQTTLKFTYREKYPDETPLHEIVSQENLDDNDVTDIMKLLEQQVRKMGFLYSLIPLHTLAGISLSNQLFLEVICY